MEVVYFVLILFGMMVAAVIVYLALLPGHFEARVSMLMNVPANKVYNQVVNLKSWIDWSPWLIHEPKIKLSYSGKVDQEGSSYSWDGQYLGAGTLTHTKLIKDKAIEQKIDFIRPFRSSSKTGWEFVQKGKNTEVHWYMKGRTPFFFRFMVKRIEKMVPMDYELGLALLNQKVDAKAPKFQLDFPGRTSLKDFYGCYDSYKGPLANLPKAVSKSFSNLMSQVKEGKIKPTAKPLIVYHKMNPNAGTTICDSVVPVDEKAEVQPIRHYNGGVYFRVQLKGDYKYLPNAWHAAVSHTRMKKLKANWSRPCLEIYSTNPFDAKHSDQYVTDIYIPLRS